MAASEGFTKDIQRQLLDHFFNDPSYTPLTNWFVGLLTAIGTGDAGTATECTGTSYARVSTAAADWGAAVVGADGVASSKANVNAVTFPTAGAGGWGTATSFGLYTASSAGTLLCVGVLTGGSQLISSGNTPSFAAGALIIMMGNIADTF